MSQFRVMGGRRRASGGSPLAKVAHWWDIESNGTASAGTNLSLSTGSPGTEAGKVGNGYSCINQASTNHWYSASTVAGQGSDYSVNLWAKLRSANTAHVGYWLLGHRGVSAGDVNFQMVFRGAGSSGPAAGEFRANIFAASTSYFCAYSNFAALDDSVWRMYTLLVDKTVNNRLELFVDGVSITTTSLASATPNNVTKNIALGGADWTTGGSGDLMVDSAGIFNAVLTQAEIDYLYNSGNGVAYADL